MSVLTSGTIQRLAYDCGFEIAGVTEAQPHADFSRFEAWSRSGKAAGLSYLTDHRGDMRADPRSLLPSAQSIICVGKIYNSGQPDSDLISRYASGLDYHDVLRPLLKGLLKRIAELHGAAFESKICIDTAPLLERSYARAAGLGWIGKNTCLINQQLGSWFFLAELLVSIPIESSFPVAERCGSCSRCIQACPTDAIVPNPAGGFDIDAGLCISYLTIEKRGFIEEELAEQHGTHLFGCDICQDVCPWNRRAHLTTDESFAARLQAPDLAELAAMNENEFRRLFRQTPVWRTRYEGFLRNVAIAMGNSGKSSLREPLLRLKSHENRVVAETARAALTRLDYGITEQFGVKLGKPDADGYYKMMQVSSPIDANLAKPAFYQDLCERLQELLGTETDFVANAANAAALLYHSLPDVNWVGFYVFKDGELIVGPFQGKPACVHIALGKGVCGTAARSQETVIVPDVSQFKGHIACDPESKSEIAVPLLNWGKLIAVLDVDSATLGRFDEDDQEGLEALSSVFVASLLTEDMPDLADLPY